jgi:isopenicillin N synthase-like dioxygenase
VEPSFVDITAGDAESAFTRSIRETGFAVLVDPPVPIGWVSAIVAEWLAFFATETKYAYRSSGEQGGGYFPFEDAGPRPERGAVGRDRKEIFHVRLDAPYPAEVSDTALRHLSAGTVLATTLLGWLLADDPGQSVACGERSVACGERSVLRIQHYLPWPEPPRPGTIRALAHTDVNLLTLLPAPSEPGLEIEGRDGVWRPVTCPTGSVVVNGGEMLEALTSGRYRAANHRVTLPGAEVARRSRVSLPLFVHAADDAVVTSRGETAARFLRRRVGELRRRGFRPTPA